MGFLRSYFHPAGKDGAEGKDTSSTAAPKDVEMTLAPPPMPSSPARPSFTSSRPTSMYPEGDFRNTPKENILDIKCDVMVSWLYQQQLERLWGNGGHGEGVVLKKSRERYTAYPDVLMRERGGFYDQIVALNVKCAMTLNTRVIGLFLSRQTIDFVPLSDGLQLQVLPSMAHLPRCQKHHFGAFIQDRQILVIWDDNPRHILDRAETIQQSLMKMIWKGESKFEDMEEKKTEDVVVMGIDAEGVSPGDLEAALQLETRPTLLINPIMVGITLLILISALGIGWRNLAQEVTVDGSFLRLALVACTPAQIFVSLFFMQIIVTDVLQIIGPIAQMNMNSKFYSGKAPRRLNRNLVTLPHVTVQMPVYKEGLVGVIQPTVMSLKSAISTYELQGGSANIFVNDDGLQLIPPDQAQARRDFYDEHNIGWVARPGHNKKLPDGRTFLRRGKFKKASNMNYALMISNKVEDKLAQIQRHSNWDQEAESRAYKQCLSEVLEGEDGRAWADGNIRVGDYILLIDCDTRVPVDCLLDAVSEMEQSPNVGILQYSSGVMQVTTSFFENGVTFFTNLIYSAICYTVANGDVAPFVGHNAILRWSALQEVSYTDMDGYEKFWSESHVSEDFDMSLRLQVEGYVIRLAAYTGDGFKEGVSLTVYDELSRWEKYAYGCNELLFHPFRYWLYRGPFTPLFLKFLTSNIRFTSKITILSYIGTYYAIGASWILTLLNYFLIGWFNVYLDHYYLDSFKVYFSLIIVFSAVGNVALAVLRYRLSQKSLFGALFENFKWLILLTIFLGGISLHVSQALLCHFFSIDMSWGSTSKEVEETSFFEEMPKLFKRFRGTFFFCLSCIGLMVAGALVFPVFWRITDFVAIYPLAIVVSSHFLLPVALNPALMMFTW